MNMPGEISTNLRYSWEQPTAEPNSHTGHTLCATPPSYGLDYPVTHNISLPSLHPTAGAELSVLDGSQNTTRPYATNWRLFDGYNNPPANYECESVYDNVEPSHRIRMNSMASSASSQSFSLSDDKRIYLPSIRPEGPEILIGCNTPYGPDSQSSYDTTYSSHYDDQMVPQSHLIHPDQTHPGGHGLATPCSYGGYSEIYMQNFGKDFRAKAPAYSLDRPYKCDKCGSSFSRNHDLKRHSRIHLDVKPFPCSCCDKAFARKDALKRHLLVKGCSKSKDPTVRGNLKPSQSTNVLAAKHAGQQDRSLRSSHGQHRSVGHENQKSATNVSKTTGTGIPSQFNEIKLQNIKCSMPTFM
ncbi:hypothetical protein MJO29_010624 [Puccinia striiformis f. sp. tritici]|uniref:C2H2-type domain-containing protein n=1 Tax=Puccinia striiformis f. sp. tritici PST-78 TaxID=1165861 RepID=A0A0L0V728_9BASI|nr:hypothetical protein Pst134EB_020623 [Puccinia striiformis f. sp. tritici]KAI7948959.1 hypothetical protein MJO29_010624 [Puccinia striiformis f. sp. tritici]KAI9619017.1 hypothetical protein KEM48_006488 [Puccinia striiformis f. sp. tritici PST-130]KNE95115.1 hypothetical protein PSTG_11592 [Puccinia striiformis f. sp. tritici PST-78]